MFVLTHWLEPMAKSNNRKSFPLRISQDLYDELRRWADEDMRSVNAQIEFLLREAVKQRRGKPTTPGDLDGTGKSAKRNKLHRKRKS